MGRDHQYIIGQYGRLEPLASSFVEGGDAVLLRELNDFKK
jgi:hypothetical protein